MLVLMRIAWLCINANLRRTIHIESPALNHLNNYQFELCSYFKAAIIKGDFKQEIGYVVMQT